MTEEIIKQDLLDIPLPIITPRLLIRPLMPDDAAALHAAKAETWDMLENWMPWARTMTTIDDDKAWAQKSYEQFLLRENFTMVACLRETMSPVVFTGLHRFDWEIRRMEIGFWCRKSAQGNGFVTESTNALTRYAFNVLKARVITLCHADGNEKSRDVIERLGFTPEGRLIKSTVTNGGKIIRDQLWYSVTDTNSLPPLDVRWGNL